MKQILQDLSSGETSLVEAPTPQSRPGGLLINTTVSLISPGTERMLVDFGKSSLLSKARSQPDKVRQVLDKISTDGLLTTVDAVRAKLTQPIPLGYCNVGVISVSGSEDLKVGQRVVSNGPHAEIVSIPKNLCASIPDNVTDETASFTVVASIGLQGIRLAEPTLGESFVVTGVGLIGLLTIQMLRANGCRVLAIDLDHEKLKLARGFGAEICNPGDGEDPVAAGLAFSRQMGVDGVIVTAASKSNDPITHAAQMCRKRGRIVLVGVTGLELSRADFYEKELSFQVSCSYGPGRYDNDYEEGGHDYPLGFVRWTEKRNFEAVLEMMSSGTIDVGPLISHRVPFEEAPNAYAILSSDKSALGILLSYSSSVEARQLNVVNIVAEPSKRNSAKPVVGFIGAGNYATRMLIPAFKKSGSILRTISSTGGTSAVVSGRRLGFAKATSDLGALLEDQQIQIVVIATRHDSHARLVAQSLRAGKHVFVEKPLALSHAELDDVRAAHAGSGKHLMVGFNRRFAPHVKVMKRLLQQVKGPKSFIMVLNAGEIPAHHWTHNPSIGGGRIIGEACHHIDLMRFLAGSTITSVQARRMGINDAEAVVEDKASITLGFADGSFGTIHYFANGAASFGKERIEVFAAGRTLQLINFRKLVAFNWPGFRNKTSLRQDKGQRDCVKAFVTAVELGLESPIPSGDLFEVAHVALEVDEILRGQS